MSRFLYHSVRVTLLGLALGCVEPKSETSQLDSYPHLNEFYGLDASLDPASDTAQLNVGAFVLRIPQSWLPMPISHIQGYFFGRPPGNLSGPAIDTDLCGNSIGNYNYSHMRAPRGDHLALLSSTPEYPAVDSLGIVYITNHPHEFDFSQGPQQIADQLLQHHVKISKHKSKIPLHSVVQLGNLIGFTSVTEISDYSSDGQGKMRKYHWRTNCKVHIIDPARKEIWCFILLSTAANFENNLSRFLAMIYSVEFGA